MVDKSDQINLGLLHGAQRNEGDSRAQLVPQVEARVYAYIYRMTFDPHLAEDLTQETLLTMLESFPKLNFTALGPFWAWIYRVALSKIQRHFSPHGNRRLNQSMSLNAEQLERCTATEVGGLNQLLQQELVGAMVRAMNALNERYRSVLMLRCFDQMSYQDIATVMGGTHLQAKLLFFRAKQSLKRQLARSGFKRSYLLPGLALFATVTSPTDKAGAAVGIGMAASSLEVSLGTVALAAATSKLGIATVAATLAVCPWAVPHFVPPSPPVYPTSDPAALALLEDPCFVSPSHIVAAHDPDGSGWAFCARSQDSSPHLPTTPRTILIDTAPSAKLAIEVPRQHWIEVGFTHPLHNGPGPDLFFAGWGCTAQRIFVTNAAQRIVEIPPALCVSQPYDYHVVALDLEGLAMEFEPRALRFFCDQDRQAQVQDFHLHQIRARVKDAP